MSADDSQGLGRAVVVCVSGGDDDSDHGRYSCKFLRRTPDSATGNVRRQCSANHAANAGVIDCPIRQAIAAVVAMPGKFAVQYCDAISAAVARQLSDHAEHLQLPAAVDVAAEGIADVNAIELDWVACGRHCHHSCRLPKKPRRTVRLGCNLN